MALADFSQLATNVFQAATIEAKRTACNIMIAAMQSNTQKKAFFSQRVTQMSPRQLDKFAADCFLVDTDKVIC